MRLGRIAPPQDEPSSNIAGDLLFTPTDKVDLRTSLTWDPHEDNLDSGFFEAGYTTNNGSIFNLGYAYRRNPIVFNVVNIRYSAFDRRSQRFQLPAAGQQLERVRRHELLRGRQHQRGRYGRRRI